MWTDPPRFLLPGIVYFAVVFAIGFVLGTIRVLIAVPAFGEQAAELAETPLMLLAAFLAARWTLRRFRISHAKRLSLLIGLTGLALLMMAEFLVVLFVRNESLQQYIVNRDPVAGVVYLLSLVIFAIMPWLVDAFRLVRSDGA